MSDSDGKDLLQQALGSKPPSRPPSPTPANQETALPTTSETGLATQTTLSSGRLTPTPVLPRLTVTGETDGDDDDKSSDASSRKSTRSTRNSSPARLSAELIIKARSQSARVKSLRKYFSQINNYPDHDLAAVKTVLQTAEEVHKAFVKEHSYLEITWPIAHLNHEYFEDEVFAQEASVICDIRQAAAIRLQQISAAPATQPAHDTSSFAKLPKLTLKVFDGTYSDWPSFRDLFNSMVINNRQLTDLERLYYLKMSVSNSASELIAHVPLTDDAFIGAWQSLTERFGNTRMLIDAQLNRLLQQSSVDRQRESAATLQQLISGVDNALNALQLIGQSVQNWDCLIVFNTVRQFPNRTRELWESTVSKSTEYPTYAQLREFATQRIRTLEQTETVRVVPSFKSAAAALRSLPAKIAQHAAAQAAAQATAQAVQKKSTAPSTQSTSSTTQPTHSTRYPCDCCGGDHYISSCAKFREVSAQDRGEVVLKRRLCKNCFGRHDLAQCKSNATCKTCSAQHHTMLHQFITTAQLPKPTLFVSPREIQSRPQ